MYLRGRSQSQALLGSPPQPPLDPALLVGSGFLPNAHQVIDPNEPSNDTILDRHAARLGGDENMRTMAGSHLSVTLVPGPTGSFQR